MMGPIWFCSEASRAHSDSSEFLALKRHYLWHFLGWFLNQIISFKIVDWPSLALDKTIIKVTWLSRVLLIFDNFLVTKVLLCLGFLIVIIWKVHFIRHVPLPILWYRPRISKNGQNNGEKQIDHTKANNDRQDLRPVPIVFFVFLSLPIITYAEGALKISN